MTAKNTSLASELDYLNKLVPSLLVRSPNFLVPSPSPKSRETAKLARQLVTKHLHKHADNAPRVSFKERNQWRIERSASFDVVVTRDFALLDYDTMPWYEWTKLRFQYVLHSLELGETRVLHVDPALGSDCGYVTQCQALSNARTALLKTHNMRFTTYYDPATEMLQLTRIPAHESAYRAPIQTAQPQKI